MVLSNVEGASAGAVANNLSAIVFGEPYSLPKQRTAITLPVQAFEKFVGDYQLLPNVVLTVSTENGKFYVRITGGENLEIFPESEKDFFLKVRDATLKFETDPSGKVTQVIFKQGGTFTAPKIK